MKPHGNRAWLGGALAVAAAALTMLALPGLAASHDRDHDPAGDAGTIQSFNPTTGVLVVDLADGGSVSGLVVSRTHIRCGDDRSHGRHRRHGRHHSLGHGRRGDATVSHRGGREDEIETEHEDEHAGRGHEEDSPGHDGTAPGSSEDPGQGAEHSARCTTDDLVSGATVKTAELVLLSGKALYRLVVLPRPEVTPATS